MGLMKVALSVSLHVGCWESGARAFVVGPGSPRGSSSRRRLPEPAPMLGGLVDSIREAYAKSQREATVQHVLVSLKVDAVKIQEELVAAGPVTAQAMAEAAMRYSTCGSRNKRPDARMAQLRGRPGELVFKRGQMAKEFEEAAFSSSLGVLQLVKTQFGWHLLRVDRRTGEEAGPPESTIPVHAADNDNDDDAPPAPGRKKQETKKKKKATPKKGFSYMYIMPLYTATGYGILFLRPPPPPPPWGSQ